MTTLFSDTLICPCRWKIPAIFFFKQDKNTPIHIYREKFNQPLFKRKELKKLFLHRLNLNRTGRGNLE